MKKNLIFIALIGLSIALKAQTTWPAGSDYVYFGHSNLNQTVGGNYALLQHKLGTTYLNSPVLINFRINNLNKMTILNNGNVGIGIDQPLEKLHVNGNILLSTNRRLIFGTDPNLGSLTIHQASCCYNTYFDFKGSVYFRGGTTTTSAMLGLQGDGTVTIGVWEKYDNTVTSTMGHKLMVNGGILCEKLKIISDVPDSDHVFEKSYKLKTIEEVSAFINLNKHLPEVPSAKCFQEDGYNVGEMDDLLLRKVEELTLYIIQLKKEIEDLKLLVNKTN